MLGNNSFGAMITPDSQSLARLPCPIHGDDSGRRRAENSATRWSRCSAQRSAVFEAMLQGWALQQRTRFLKAETISSRIRLARRVAEFANEYPWRWECADVEAFI